jgi:transposase-like protein
MTEPKKPRTRHTLALRLECRKEWVEGHGTLAEIARKHGIPEATVKAWYKRDGWRAARKRWYAGQLSDNEAPAKPQSYAINPKITTNAHAEMLQRLAMQLNALDNFIDNAKSADELRKYSAARKSLFEQWRILAGIPMPGSRRLAKELPPKMLPVEPLTVAPISKAIPLNSAA